MNEVDLDRARKITEASVGVDYVTEPVLFIAESLRRAASVRCPLTRRTLEGVVHSALSPLFDVSLEQVGDVVESLLSSGDLVEAQGEPASARNQIFLGPPRFVSRRDSSLVVLGIRPDNAEFLPEQLNARVALLGHMRLLPEVTSEDRDLLLENGFLAVSEATWLQHEDPIPASELVRVCTEALDRQSPSGEIDELTVINPDSRTTFYRGRWRSPRPSDSGVFVGRRPQRYGSDIWTLVRLREGATTRMLDLPIFPNQRGCDDAWRLQAAIDAERSNPQVARVSRTGQGRIRIGLCSPPPRWLQRRWDLLGTPSASPGSLVAYEFDVALAREEIHFLQDHLWMNPITSQESSQ